MSADVHRGQMCLLPWQLELQVTVMPSVGTGNPNLDPLQQ